jgi:hypothetical protein
MTIEFYVFTDSRETVGGDYPLHGIRPNDYPELHHFLAQHPWRYPHHVLYKEEGDKRWTIVTLRRQGVRDEEAD